jgi:hypothetical protein
MEATPARGFARFIQISSKIVNKFKHMLDFLKEESLEFKPVHQLRNQGAA